ncbi:MAG: hypothetical protein ACK4GB_01270 [Tepidimonas sp.]
MQHLRLSRAARPMSGLCLGTILLAGVPPALAVSPWVWTDDNGRRVYSDQPPPPSVPSSRILSQPAVRPAPLPAVDSPTAPPAPPVPLAAPSAATLGNAPPPRPASGEDDKAQQEREAIEKRNAEIRADNCRRARAGLATLQGGGRLVTTDEQGRRVTLTEAMKASERTRLEGVIRDNCR